MSARLATAATGDRNRVHARRLELGLTRAELGNRCGLDRVTLWRLECRAERPRPATRILLAAALGCDAADLFPEYPPGPALSRSLAGAFVYVAFPPDLEAGDRLYVFDTFEAALAFRREGRRDWAVSEEPVLDVAFVRETSGP